MFKLIILSLGLTSNLWAAEVQGQNLLDKAIYGSDDRLDFYESKDEALKAYSGSVLAQIYTTNLEEQDNGKMLYTYPTYGEVGIDRVCSNERFVKQQVGANCTGFLVAPNVLVTAAHCIAQDSDCEDFVWALDYRYESEKIKPFEFKKEQLVQCSKILERVHEGDTGLDYAVVELKRSLDRKPLKFRREGKIEASANLSVIGFPVGLPLKITTNAKVRDNKLGSHFVTNSDTFFGNSGSPVFNMQTGLVEGILVRGEQDYKKNVERDCREVSRYPEDGGRGEDVVRITNIKILKNLK